MYEFKTHNYVLLRVHPIILGFRFKTKQLQLTVSQLFNMFGPEFKTLKPLKPKLVHIYFYASNFSH